VDEWTCFACGSGALCVRISDMLIIAEVRGRSGSRRITIRLDGGGASECFLDEHGYRWCSHTRNIRAAVHKIMFLASALNCELPPHLVAYLESL